ncbi:MAG TPA: VOC family protein [Solirubrobacteraceae bacterium]|jgi:catechol 2,3-dioxygenase|nr:VOC family protein [Solirubrobacteraceae bacterium]
MQSAEAIDPSLRIASVRLDVGDLDRSASFYERTLGLPLIAREPDSALLGADARHPALELHAIADPTPVSPHSTGLFHVAWLHPSRAALADTVRRIVARRWPIDGASDHGVSEALYLSDPDGLGIEIYADRPRDQWQRPPDGHGVSMVTLPLDLDDLLAQSSGEPDSAVAPGTAIGHVHLKVADVPRADTFYRQALGFDMQAQLPSAAFVSAGGYHHHIGMNSWQSAGADAPAPTAPRLRAIEFELGDEAAVDALRRRAETAGASTLTPGGEADGQNGAGVAVEDPDGNRLNFALASG